MTDSDSDSIRISIIVPVYNVADYLRESLQSILDQSVDFAFEAVLVDDCSSDDSASICADFCARHPAIFQLVQNPTNLGVSAARNAGLERVSGDYFTFVDPDDVLPPNALRYLGAAADEHNVDIIKGNNTIFDETREFPARYNVGKEIGITGDEVLTTLYQHNFLRGHTWGKLLKRDRLGHLRFPLGVRMAQDLYYNGEVFSTAESLRLIDKTVYRYRLRKTGSTGRKFETGAYMDWLDSVAKIGVYASNRQQRQAYRTLLVRTMTQIARECRDIPASLATTVLPTIEQKCDAWNIRLGTMIFGESGSLASLGRYLKLRLALRRIRQNLATTR